MAASAVITPSKCARVRFCLEEGGRGEREGWREYSRSAVVLNTAAALINVWMESHIITGRVGDMDTKSKP